MNENSGASGASMSEQERTASLLAGGGLALAGLQLCAKGRLPAALGLLAIGGALLYRSKTQHCPLYEAAGVNRAEDGAQNGQRSDFQDGPNQYAQISGAAFGARAKRRH